MSQARQVAEGGEKQVRELLRRDFAPWEKSKQAVYHQRNGRKAFHEIRRHNDGERIYKDFSLTPLWKALERAERNEHPVWRFPQAYLNGLIHIDDREIYAVEEQDYEYFENQPRTRRKVMEWLMKENNQHVLEAMDDGGTDFHAHAKPGKGKSSFLNVIGAVRNAEINNDTILWLLTLDELECLPIAPYTTIAVPKGVEIDVEAKPKDYRLPKVSIELTDIFRDVIEFEDPSDLFEKVVPGGLYAVLPDPYFRECESLVRAKYISAWDADEPREVTPLRDWVHAAIEVRAKHDLFLHQTTFIIDEFGDLLPKNPEADEADTYRKCQRYPKTYAKLRKKNGSVYAASHSLKQVHEDVLEKERTFVTMPNTPVPSGSLAGLGNVPVPSKYTTGMAKGKAVSWNQTNYCPISWANPFRRYDFVGEINIRYPKMERAL